MKIESIEEIEPIPSRCIEVDSEDRLFRAGGESGAAIVTHNSVAQRNIIFGAIMRPDRWRFLGVDLKKVELSNFRAYSNVVLGIATTLEDGLTVLRFAQQTMMKRYAELEQLGLNNFTKLPDPGQALMVMIDEAGELLGTSGVKALSEDTPIMLANGEKTTLKNISEGDWILDNRSQPTEVITKYEPREQSKYSLSISKDSTKEKEDFVAGSEHYWVAYFEEPDGTVIGPETVTTEYLYAFKKEQDRKPEAERTQVKFKRLNP